MLRIDKEGWKIRLWDGSNYRDVFTNLQYDGENYHGYTLGKRYIPIKIERDNNDRFTATFRFDVAHLDESLQSKYKLVSDDPAKPFGTSWGQTNDNREDLPPVRHKIISKELAQARNTIGVCRQLDASEETPKVCLHINDDGRPTIPAFDTKNSAAVTRARKHNKTSSPKDSEKTFHEITPESWVPIPGPSVLYKRPLFSKTYEITGIVER